MTGSDGRLTVALSRVVAGIFEDFGTSAGKVAGWIEKVRTSTLPDQLCAICEVRKGPFESHHVAGRNNSDLCVTVCIRCHSRLSERQNHWDPRWTAVSKPEALRWTFLLFGLGDLCQERARHGNNAYHLTAKRLWAIYAEWARETNS